MSIVERVEINYSDMPSVETPSFSETDVGKSYIAELKISLTEIDRALRSEEGEQPHRNIYVFKLNEVTSIVEDV